MSWTCETKQSHLCTGKAEYLYHGVSVEVYLCTNAAFIKMRETNLNTNKPPYMECLAVSRVTLTCNSCKSQFRFERTGLRTSTWIPDFCPHCGTKGVVTTLDAERDYWEILAESYGLTVELTKGLYEIWDPNMDQNFGDFVRKELAEVNEKINDDGNK